MNEQTIFTAAIEFSAAERSAYLDRACGSNDELRRRVEKLIKLHENAGDFLEHPAAAADETGLEIHCEKPGMQIGPYKLLQQIGEGGMGTVFMAEQIRPVQRKVAVKVIKPGMDTRQVIARFDAERQALALMDHVNIARVLDAGTTGAGRPYFVMELVQGVPITRYCDDNHLTPRQRLELFVPVCHAIQHAHQKGIIHRDIKPSNVMVTLYDGKPVPKVIDFGVAKATEQRLTERTLFTQYGTLVGTLEYMSPEQAEMSALGVDTRSDIYSLGVLLYELLTGTTPLGPKRVREAAFAEILRMIKEEEPDRPSMRLSESGASLASISAQRQMEPAKLTKLVRGELDWIVMKTLEKDRNRRYETASGFAADVQRYLDDEPVQACPPSATYRLRKLMRRNKGPVLAAFLLVMALVGGIIGTTLGMFHATEAESRALIAANEKEIALGAARESEKNANEQLFQALVSQARAERISGRSGQRFGALRAIRKAAQIHITSELRTEAIAALVLPDAEVALEWEGWTEDTIGVVANVAFERFARLDKRGGVTIFGLQAGREEVITRLPAHGKPPFYGLWMSADGRFLAYGHSCVRQAVPREVRVWKLDGPAPTVLLDVLDGMHESALAFQPDGRRVAIGHADSSVSIYDLENGRRERRLAVGSAPMHLAFHPRDDRLAVGCDHAVQLFRTDTGGELPALRPPAPVTQARWLSWHPDGRRLAAGCNDRKIHLWDTQTASEVMSPWSGHTTDGMQLAFNNAGDRLISVDWGMPTRLWDAATGRSLLTMPGDLGLQFSPDDGLLGLALSGHKIKVTRLAGGRELRIIRRRQADSVENIHNPSMHPDGRTLAACTSYGLSFFDLFTGEELASVRRPAGATVRPVVFAATRPLHSSEGRSHGEQSGGWITGGTDGLCLWPARPDVTDPDVLCVGPPLPLAPGLAPSHSSGASISADSQVLAVPNGDATLVLHGEQPGRQVVLSPQYDVRFTAVSPDGVWVVTSSHFSDGQSKSSRIWNAQTGRLVRELPLEGSSSARFSPDGRWLVTMGSNGCRLWEAGTWREVRRLDSRDEAGIAAFSPDSRLLAIGDVFNLVRLVEVTTGREVARLTGPVPTWYSPACFTPDGTRLITTCSGNSAIYVWDLRLIRQQLKELDLDWEWEDFPTPVQSESDRDSGVATRQLRIIDPATLRERAQTLVATRKWDEALAVYDEVIRLNPEAAGPYFDRGDAYAQVGRWTDSAGDYSRALELDPSDHFNWYRLAALRLSSGDVEGYRSGCREMLARFGQADTPVEIADRVAKTCLLAADAVADLAHVQRLADRAVTDTRQHRFYRWFLLTKGLAEYRAGRDTSAIEWLTRFGPREDGVHWNASAFSILAMAQHRLGRAEESLAALTSAQAVITQSMPDPRQGRPFDDVNNWLDWLHPQLLCREAEELQKETEAGTSDVGEQTMLH